MTKADFPIFTRHPDLVYLDSAATALKPQPVIDAVTEYLTEYSTNAARGLYPLAESTSARIEEVRQDIARFIHAQPEEIIFTSGTTAGVNLVARMLESGLGEKSSIIVSSSEHHSNFLPWAELARRTSAALRITESTPEGSIDEETLSQALDASVRLVALTAVSNVFGVKNDVPALVARIRQEAPYAFIIVDAAQWAAHAAIDVAAWDADAVVFSGHKLYGPTGIGVLWLRTDRLENLSPASFGGGMVLSADPQDLRYKPGPEGLEAGTLNLEGIFGLGAAVRYVLAIGFDAIRAHETELTAYALSELERVFGDSLKILGSREAERRIGLISFTIRGAHPHDLASFLGSKDIAVRAGEHCASPLHRAVGIPASTRLSFGLYTEKRDIDAALAALREAHALLTGDTPRT